MTVFRGLFAAASLKLMEIAPIRTQRDYRRALKEIEGRDERKAVTRGRQISCFIQASSQAPMYLAGSCV